MLEMKKFSIICRVQSTLIRVPPPMVTIPASLHSTHFNQLNLY